MQSESGRSGLLDVLRSVAILLVLLRHGVSLEAAAPESSVLANLASNGWLGVDLFFVLSGYLLCSQIIGERERGTWDPRNFYLRRAVRILPPYLTVLLICWAGGLAWLLGTNGVLSPLVLLDHLLFVQDYRGTPLLVTLWSLATEEKFYLAIPFLAAALIRMDRKRAAVLLVAASLLVAIARTATVGVDAPSNYPLFFWKFRAPFHFAIDGLLIGTATAFAERYFSIRWRLSRRLAYVCGAAAIASLFVVLCAANWLSGPGFVMSSIVIWCFSACCGVLILMGRLSAIEERLPPVPGLVARIATLSYALYLVHYPAALLAQRLFAMENGSPRFWIFYIGLSLLLAWILNSLTEAPFRGLRQRLRQAKPREVEKMASATQATGS